MEVKEMIEFDCINFLKSFKEFVTREFCNPPGIRDINKRIDETIALLQQGEALKIENIELKKYRQIVDELSRILPKPRYIYKNCNGKAFEYYCNANAIEVLNSIKQKYFPKEAKE